MQLSKFFEKALGDGARTNKFDVFFSIDGSQFDKRLSLLLQSTSLPSVTTSVIEYKYKGKTIPIPISCDYTQEWECTFLVDDNHDIKTFFENWIELYSLRAEDMSFTGKQSDYINIPGGGKFDKTTINVRVTQYNFNAEVNPFTSNEHNITAEYMIYNVFPVSVSPLKYDTEDEIQTITVAFKFSHFERI